MLIQARQAALSQAPLTELPKHNNNDNAIQPRRIQLQGCFVHDREFLVGPRGPPPEAVLPNQRQQAASGGSTAAAPSQMGYYVLTPFVVFPESVLSPRVRKYPSHDERRGCQAVSPHTDDRDVLVVQV